MSVYPISMVKESECVCLFFMGGLTVEPTALKFCMEDHIYAR